MKTIVLFLVAAMTAVCAACAQTPIDETRPAEVNGIIEVNNIKGSVTVMGADTNELRITGTLGKGSERLDVTASGPRIRVAVILPEDSDEAEASKLELHVPKGSSLEIECVAGTVAVSDVAGRLTLATVNGGIAVTGAAGEAYLKSVNGKIALAGAPTEAEISTVNGSIDIAGVTSRVNASTISGGISIATEGVKRVIAKTVRGSVSFTGSIADDATMDITTQQGGITLTLPETTSGAFDLSTFTGSIENTLAEAQPAAAKKPASGRTLEFSMGSGSASIRAKSFNGGISLVKK